MTYHIVPCELKHLRKVARNLRPEELVECAAVGAVPRHMMFALWVASTYRRTALVDGRPVAVWGDAAPILSSDGHAWLFTTPALDRMPITFFKQAGIEISIMLQMRSVIRTSILNSSWRSLRFWSMLGFRICEPDTRGLREIWVDRSMFHVEQQEAA